MEYLESTETDVAYQLLAEKHEPCYYKDLILEVIEKKAKPVQSLARAISEVYTLINMDSRFQYAGDGLWGLTEWRPPEPKRSHGTSTGTSAAGAAKSTRRREKLLESIQEG
ncbi:MAG: DNA-directed RNA polymerase subunit delta [Schwartzia sp. (in: firmicutes)]